MKIALLQMAILEKNKAANVAHGLELLRQAAPEHDLAVLPEIWTMGYSLRHVAEHAETPDNELMQEVSGIAAANNCAILAGSVPMEVAGKIYNTAVLFDKSGRKVKSYSKVHLFKLFHEDSFFAAGDDFDACELDGVCCGLTICHDLRYPELYRHLALQGAQLVFCPAEWPAARGADWRLLAQARAMENHNFLIAVNCAGEFKGAPFYGHSMVVGPSGTILAEAGSGEAVLTCSIDLAALDKERQKMNTIL